MHNGFLDKRRRFLNLREMQVENVLPEHFAQFYPKFISLLKNYYEWQDQNDPNELLNHLFAVRDINETDISLLSFIEDEFLLGEAYFEGFGENDWEKRAAANFSNQLFRSKGTKFAIEWFFRSFYGLDAEVEYPKENVFTLNDTASQIGPDSLHYLTNDKLYQAFALLIRVGVPISKWRDIFKLFAHPAGLYLGAEVSVDDIITDNINSVMLDSAVTQRASSVFTITPLPSSISEGGTINFRVNASNVPGNIGSIYYYVTHDTTSDSDFVGSVPSFDSAAYLAINDSAGSAVGRFSLITAIDSVETEGTEQFQVFLRDTLGRTRGGTVVSINDVVSSYSLVPSSTLVSEGTPVVFTATGTNVPSGGSTTLYYYVEHITTDSNDFFVAPPDSASPLPFLIRNDSGSFTLTPVRDGDLLDSGEQFKVIIQTFDGIKKDSATVTIANTAPVFSLSAIGAVTEGSNLVASFTADANDIGDTLTWSITGPAASDSRFAATSGSTILTSTSQNIVVATTSGDSYLGTVSGTFSITNAKYDPDLTISSGFSIVDEPAEYSILMNPSIITEGDSARFQLTGRNIQDSTYFFYIDNITTNDLDFLAGRPKNTSREGVSVANNFGQSQKVFFSDSSEVVDQNFIAYMYDQAIGGTLLASQQFTIVGTAYTINESVTSVNEGGSVTFTFTGPDGVYYYWINVVSGFITQGDFSSGFATEVGSPGRASFIVSGGTGQFSVSLTSDVRFEGNETFTVKVSTTDVSGAVIESDVVTINDTSKQEYTMTIPNIVEGNALVVNVATNNGPSEALFYEISGAAAAKFGTTQIYSLYTGAQTSFSVNLGTSTTNNAHEGGLAGTVTLSRGGYVGSGGTLITTANFTVLDASAVYTLAASTTTPTEGGSINWTIGGSNIPNGTYYYRITDIFATTTTGSTASGSSIINLSDTSGIAIGMRTNGIGIPGTVTFVNSTSVTMSTPVTATISAGSTVQFLTQALFDDFSSGYASTVSVTSNAGGFTTTTAVNADTINDTYTMGLYTSSSSNTPVATVGFTITDATPNSTVNIAIDPAETATTWDLTFGGAGSLAQAIIRFQSNGTILATGNIDPGGTNIQIGTWTSGTPVGNFNVTATIASGPTGSGNSYGSYGTSLSLSSNRSWYLELAAPAVGSRDSFMTVSITVTDASDPSNTDTQLFTFKCEAEALGNDSELQ